MCVCVCVCACVCNVNMNTPDHKAKVHVCTCMQHKRGRTAVLLATVHVRTGQMTTTEAVAVDCIQDQTGSPCPEKGVVKLWINGLHVLQTEWLAQQLLVEGHREPIVNELAMVESLGGVGHTRGYWQGWQCVRTLMYVRTYAHTMHENALFTM